MFSTTICIRKTGKFLLSLQPLVRTYDGGVGGAGANGEFYLEHQQGRSVSKKYTIIIFIKSLFLIRNHL